MGRERLNDTRKRTEQIIRILRRTYPDARCALTFQTPHQLLVATILSAQCTDERVNAVTPALFAKYPSVTAFAEANLEELARDIFSTGFHNTKAKSLKQSASEVLTRFGGELPRTLDELTTLPGVGRKTASVVLGVTFGLAQGIVVDTHVGRIARLLRLTRATDPVKVERDLMKTVPEKEWIHFSHLLIWHGRAICKARGPNCPECPLQKLCPSARL